MKNSSIAIMTVIATLFLSATSGLAFSMPKIFADNMVLQRDMPVPLWGEGPPGVELTVTYREQVKSTVTF